MPQALHPYMAGAVHLGGEVMRILVTNDDGIHAEGLAVLERIAASLTDDVWVVRAGDRAIGRLAAP